MICGILGLDFAVIGWRAASADPGRGRRGLAIAGTILGAIAIVLAIIGIAIVDDAVDDLDRELDELDPGEGVPVVTLTAAARLCAGLVRAVG